MKYFSQMMVMILHDVSLALILTSLITKDFEVESFFVFPVMVFFIFRFWRSLERTVYISDSGDVYEEVEDE